MIFRQMRGLVKESGTGGGSRARWHGDEGPLGMPGTGPEVREKHRIFAMKQFSTGRVLLLRAGLGVAFALLLTRLFRPAEDAGFVAVLAVLLVLAAYLLESLRRR